MRVVGPFPSPADADAYGKARHGEQVTYLGWGRRTGLAELDQVIGAKQAAAGSPGHNWTGTVTRWEPGQSQGFITDRDGRSWFVSRDDLPEGMTALVVGTRVWFSGSPHPKPGKKYPQAYSVRTAPPA